jgi:regulatory protein
MDMLARREHTCGELVQKLVTRGHPPASAEATVAALQREGLVSDERFVEMLLHARRGRGVGPLRIQQELRQKGVAPELIERWLDPSSPEWIAQVRRARQKKFGDSPPADRAEYARQVRFLQYRGYTFDQIQHVLTSDDTD